MWMVSSFHSWVLHVHAVLKKDKKPLEVRSGKDYATAKWEEELRAELEAKRISQNQVKNVKLTRDQQVLVNAQLAKEKEIRARVETLHQSLTRGIAIIQQLASVPNEECHQDVTIWMNHLFDALHYSDQLGGRMAVTVGWTVPTKCFQAIKEIAKTVATAEIQSIAEAVSIATARSLEIQTVDEAWLKEDFHTQVNRVVDKLRNATEDLGQLPSATFAYCFPLLEHIVFSSRKEKQSSVLDSTVDILAAHASIGDEPAIPRKQYMDVLIQIIGNFPKHAKTAQVGSPFVGYSLLDSAGYVNGTLWLHR